MSQQKQEKEPIYMKDINDLKEGDIIMFRVSPKPNMIHRAIMFMQSLIGQKHGHYDTTHAGICTGIDKDGNPMVAHLTGSGYKHEPLKEMIKRDGGDRAFVAYRPEDDSIAKSISKAAVKKNNDKIKWKIHAASGAFLRKAKLDSRRDIDDDKSFAESSFCSKFVVQAIKAGSKPSHHLPLDATVKYYPNIRSSSTPKALEAELYNNSNYQMLVHPGKTNPYQLMKDEIEAQLKRISKRTDLQSKEKVKNMKSKFEELTTKLERSGFNDLQKATKLLAGMSSVLRVNTGYNVRETESYKTVMQKARGVGIFERDVKKTEDDSAKLSPS